MEEQNMQQEQPQQGQEPVMQADPADVEKNKTMAILAYFIFFLPLVTDAKNSPFAKFHANQSFIIFLVSIALSVISGALITLIITIPAGLALLVFWIMGLMNASNGKMKELPIIGGIHILDK